MKQVLILLILSCSLLAEKPVNLRMEKKTPAEFFSSVAKISGKQLVVKCKLPELKHNWLYFNAPLDLVLGDACQSISLKFAVIGNKIIIDKKRIPRPDDRQYSIDINSAFQKAFNENNRSLDAMFGELIGELSACQFRNKRLVFSCVPDQYKEFTKALKILGFVDAKRELIIKFAVQRGSDTNLKIHEFTLKENGSDEAEIIGLGKCRLTVSNVDVSVTGCRSFDIKFSWDRGEWFQEFRDTEELTGAIPLNEELQTSIEAKYLLDGEEFSKNFFGLDTQLQSTEKVVNQLRRAVPEVSWHDKPLEKCIAQLQKEILTPVTVAFNNKIFPMPEGIDPLEEQDPFAEDPSTAKPPLFGVSNLEANNIPVGEAIRYLCMSLGLNYSLKDDRVIIHSPNNKLLLNLFLFRISENYIHELKDSFENRERGGGQGLGGTSPETFHEFVADALQLKSVSKLQRNPTSSFFYGSVSSDSAFSLRLPTPGSSGVEIFELLFHSDKDFHEFKKKAAEIGFAPVVSEFFKRNKILSAKNMFMLSLNGSLTNKMGTLKIKNELASYESKISGLKAEFTVKTFKYSKIVEADGKVRVVCEPPFLFEEDRSRYEIVSIEDGDKKDLNLKELTLEESVEAVREKFETRIFLRTDHQNSLPGPAVDPFEDDPFGELADDNTETIPKEHPKFSLNIQNLSEYEIATILAYVTSHKIRVDTHAVFISSPSVSFCGGMTTRFFRMKKSILDRLGWKSESTTNSDIIGQINHSESEKTYENGFMELVRWGAGSQIVYLPGVERLVVTLSTYEFPVLKAVLDLIDQTTVASVNFMEETIELAEGMRITKGNNYVENVSDGVITGDENVSAKFNRSIFLRELTHPGGGFFRNARSLKQVKKEEKKYMIPEFRVDSGDLNQILYDLSLTCQKLKLPDIYVNLIVRIDETQNKKKLQKDYKNIEVLDLLETLAHHFKLRLIFSKNKTVFTDYTSEFYPDEIILLTLKNEITEKSELIKLISPQIRFLAGETADTDTEIEDPFAEGFEIELKKFILKPKLKLLKGGQVIFHGKSPLVRAIENDLRNKNLLAVDTPLKFNLEVEGKEVFSFNQNVVEGKSVSVRGKSGWNLSITPEKEKWVLEFSGNKSWKRQIPKAGTSGKSLKLTDELTLKLY